VAWAAFNTPDREEAEVVVGTEIQHPLAIYRDLRALFAGDDALALVKPGFFNGGEFGLQVCFEFSVHIGFCFRGSNPRRR
jgi:hypothetical protein